MRTPHTMYTPSFGTSRKRKKKYKTITHDVACFIVKTREFDIPIRLLVIKSDFINETTTIAYYRTRVLCILKCSFSQV